MEPYINLLDVCEEGSTQLGPGLRYCIWVQGCPFNCKGCTTPEGIPIVPNKLISLDALAKSIFENKKISGITISGGEPFLQASKLTVLLREVRVQRPALNVIIFTGFKKKELDWEEAVELLNYTDVLIDGRYLEKYDDNKGLRGSSNQTVHFLTNRLSAEKDYFLERKRSIDVFVQNGHSIMIGIPNKNLTK